MKKIDPYARERQAVQQLKDWDHLPPGDYIVTLDEDGTIVQVQEDKEDGKIWKRSHT
jgi:hypothetical protein